MNESVDVSTPVRAIIADDHPLVLLAVENLMTGFHNMQIVGRASDTVELFAEADRVECDLAVVDLHMPGSVDADVFCGASGFFGHRFGVKRVFQTGVVDGEES